MKGIAQDILLNSAQYLNCKGGGGGGRGEGSFPD